MRKLITIFAIFFVVITNAQTFDETVNYINNFLKEYPDVSWVPSSSSSAYFADRVIVTKNGKVTFMHTFSGGSEDSTGFFNVFDFQKFNESGEVLELWDSNNKRIGGFYRFPSNYISKIEKAFKHLQTLCTKEKDLFE
ncbi:hypothetical protein JI747_014070 [Chryseobacterium sp. RG1]|uniref:Uncharacterized protein n=1 Tax=Chryseobacterium tagetis TaxID=2801334 RepID=A0ABS8A2V3_9FLAO|nr:hypothetical protein [Chryseobacterium tagetis]MCA6068314.1 hypothetical protein [Chryseobacterium tagetis]